MVKERYWPGTVMGISIFASLLTVMWFGRRTFIEPLVIARWMVLLCVVGTLLPYRWSGLRLGMAKFEWFLFNVLAIGPLTICALIAINHFVHGPVRWFSSEFETSVRIAEGDAPDLREHVLPWREVFHISESEMAASKSGRYRVGVARGCFGYWSVTQVEALP